MTHEISFATAAAPRGTARARTDAPSSRAVAPCGGTSDVGLTNMRCRVFIAGGDP